MHNDLKVMTLEKDLKVTMIKLMTMSSHHILMVQITNITEQQTLPLNILSRHMLETIYNTSINILQKVLAERGIK